MQVLLYNPLRRTKYLQLLASIVMLFSFFAGITAVALMWRTSPAEYDHSAYLSNSLFFFRTQRLGHLPTTNGVPWRSDALTYELGPGSTDITGGWATGEPLPVISAGLPPPEWALPKCTCQSRRPGHGLRSSSGLLEPHCVTMTHHQDPGHVHEGEDWDHHLGHATIPPPSGDLCRCFPSMRCAQIGLFQLLEHFDRAEGMS